MIQVGKNAILWFGKYKGRSIEWISENDIGYLAWAKRESVFEIDDTDILQMIDDHEDEQGEIASGFGNPEWYKWNE